jgi:cob(I)alamin adenosyltransferase
MDGDFKVPYYTRTGDSGETSLIGGERVSKDDLRVECYGNVDELNCFISLAVLYSKDEKLKNLLIKIQRDLFTLGADLAAPLNISEKLKVPRITKEYIDFLENKIDEFAKDLNPLHRFIIPGGSLLATYLHIARSICRRTERSAIKLSKIYDINKNIVPYLNRLSSLFFVLARYANKLENINDIEI